MQRGQIFGILFLLTAAAAQEEDEFGVAEDESALESALSDRQERQRGSLRWRVRGSEWDPDRLHLYQRAEWRRSEGEEAYLLVERDPGERRWADFAAFYLQWGQDGQPVRLVGGDLRPGWGTGLVFSRGAGFSSALLPHPGGDSERLGYRASAENQALRGIALRCQSRRWKGVLVGGQAWRDARLGKEGQVTSLPESGYHVTEVEEAGRHLLKMRVAGGRMQYQAGFGKVGASLLGIGFDRRVDLRRGERKPWAFSGNGQQLLAVDGEWRMGRGELRGEVARDAQGHWGMVAGTRIDLGKMRLRCLGRRYDPGFYSFFGGAPSRGEMANEEGCLLVLEGRGWKVFADRYRRPQRTYYYPLPSEVKSQGAILARRLGRKVQVRLLYQEEGQPRWREGQSVAEDVRRFRTEVEGGRGRGGMARIRLRLEGRWLREAEKTERGGLASLLWQGCWRRGEMTLHFARFRTDSYDSRLSEAECDLPGLVSIRPLYGNGWRGYVLAGIGWGSLKLSGRYRLQQTRQRQHYFGAQVDVHFER